MSDESEAGEGRPVRGSEAAGDAVDGVVEDATSSEAGDAADKVTLAKSDGVVDGEVVDSGVVDSESAGSEGSVRESALVGASSAGSARAAARRSGVRAGVTPTKGAATKQRDSGREVRASYFVRLRRFLREVIAELRKVIWPARNQMVTYTIVVIVFVVFMVALTAGLDVLFAKVVLAVFG